MSSEGRQHIDNAIWLCATHARLIDRDEAIYTIDRLHQMKRDHEAACAEEVRRPSDQSMRTHDIIVLGPDIVCTGELLGVDGSEWPLHLKNFVRSDFNTLVAFDETFLSSSRGNHYILVNALGDGRILTSAPSLAKSEIGNVVRCRVAPSFPRVEAKKLGSQWDISPKTDDMFAENGHIARVSGLASAAAGHTTMFVDAARRKPDFPGFWGALCSELRLVS